MPEDPRRLIADRIDVICVVERLKLIREELADLMENETSNAHDHVAREGIVVDLRQQGIFFPLDVDSSQRVEFLDFHFWVDISAMIRTDYSLKTVILNNSIS